MRITAKLALSQVRKSKQRSLGAIFAIAMSTALLMTISSFVFSGRVMLQEMLGENYGVYGTSYMAYLLIPALIFSLLICVMAVTIISNVFQNSAEQRLKQFSILKCVGGTAKQIRETVIFECIWLSMIGIPLGIGLGMLFGVCGASVIEAFVEEANRLQKSIAMQPFEISFHYVLTPEAVVIAAVFSLTVVWYAAYKPAKKAAKITASEGMHAGLGEENHKQGRQRRKIKNAHHSFENSRVINAFMGFEGVYANRNLQRNAKRHQTTVRVLALAIMLILTAGSLIEQLHLISAYMDPGIEDIIVDYCSSREKHVNETTGRVEEIYHKPIDSSTVEQVTTQLAAYENQEVAAVGNDTATYYVKASKEHMTEALQECLTESLPGMYEVKADLMVLDRANYEKLCQKAEVPVGSVLLINNYEYNDNGYLKKIVPFTDAMEQVTLYRADDTKRQLAIDATVSMELLPEQARNGIRMTPLHLVVPEWSVRYCTWYCKPEDEQGYMDYAREVTDRFFPRMTDNSYQLEGFTVRISRADMLVKVLNIAIVIGQILLYGFIILLLCIGFVSTVSTLLTAQLLRAREFAILKSVGMTMKSLQKMMLCESVLCTAKAAVWGVPLGILFPYLINVSIRAMFPVRYRIPWGLLGISLSFVFALIAGISCWTVYRMRKQNISENIRVEML